MHPRPGSGDEVGVSHRRRDGGMTCGLLDYLEVHTGLNKSGRGSCTSIVPLVVLDTGIFPARPPTISCSPPSRTLSRQSYPSLPSGLQQCGTQKRDFPHIPDHEGVAWLPVLGHAEPHDLTIGPRPARRGSVLAPLHRSFFSNLPSLLLPICADRVASSRLEDTKTSAALST